MKSEVIADHAGERVTADLLDVRNIGARVFRRPKVKIRSAKTGEEIAPERLAENLVAAAVLEHAVVEGRRPKVTQCKDCGTPVVAAKTGRTSSSRCARCRHPFPNCIVCGVDLPLPARGKQLNKTGKCLPCSRAGMSETIRAKLTPEQRRARSANGGKAVAAAKTAEERKEQMRNVASKVDPKVRVRRMREALRAMPEEDRKARTRAANVARHGPKA